MKKYIEKLSPEEENQMSAWAQKWIDIGLKTGEIDKERFERGIRVAYEKANIPFPNRIVYVPSPIHGAYASIIANGIWAKRASVGDSVGASVGDSVGASVGDSVGASVRDSVDASVRASVRASVDASVDASVRASVGDSVGASVGASVRASVRASVDDSVDDSVGASVGDSVRASVDDSVRASVDASVRASVGDSVGDSVGASVGDSVRASVDASVDDSVGASVGDSVGDSVGASVGASVGDSVGDSVGASVGDSVRASVDASVDDSVGASVGDSVGDSVGASVGASYKIAFKNLISFYGLTKSLLIGWHYCLGGQFWVGGWYWGNAFVSFFIEVCKLEITDDIRERYEAYRDINESVNYVWANKNFVMVCERPQIIRRNDEGQLSSDQGKAIEYKDGWGLYVLDGVVLEEKMYWRIISKEMTLSEIMKIEISDQRTIALKYNPQAIIKEKAKLVHKDERSNELYLVKDSEINTLTNFPKMYFLKMTCPTGRVFIEGCDPNVVQSLGEDATKLQAYACGLTLSEYKSMKMES